MGHAPSDVPIINVRRLEARSAALAVLLAATLAGCASTATTRAELPSLEPVIVFANASTCEYGPPLERLFGGLAVWNEQAQRVEAGAPFLVQGLSGPIVPRLTQLPDDYLRTEAPLRGSWHGLTVTAVGTEFIPESDVGWRYIRFAEPPDRVLSVLNARGFGLDPATGRSEVQVSTPEWDRSVALSVEAGDRGSTLACDESY